MDKKNKDTNKMIKLGNLYPSSGQAGWIYSTKGICPALVTMTGGAGKEPKILVKNGRYK